MEERKFEEIYALLEKMLEEAYQRGKRDALKETSKGHSSTELFQDEIVKYNIVERKKEEKK